MSSEQKRSKRLGRVADLAEDSEQKAAHRLAESQSHVDEARRQLEELEGYKAEYLAMIDGATGQGASSISKLRNQRTFLVRIGDAVEAQIQTIKQTKKQYSACREEWLDERAHAKALGKVVDQCRADEDRLVERRENREQDDRSQHVTTHWD